MNNDKDFLDEPKITKSPVLGSSTFKKKYLRASGNPNVKTRLICKLKNDKEISEEFIEKDNSLSREQILNKNDSTTLNSGTSANVTPNTEHKPIGFQTASGKPLVSRTESSSFANNLMSEFFAPSTLTNKERKYRFLSKRANLQHKIPTGAQFLGFQEGEHKQSIDIIANIQKIITALSDQKCSTADESKESISLKSDIVEKISYEHKKIFSSEYEESSQKALCIEGPQSHDDMEGKPKCVTVDSGQGLPEQTQINKYYENSVVYTDLLELEPKEKIPVRTNDEKKYICDSKKDITTFCERNTLLNVEKFDLLQETNKLKNFNTSTPQFTTASGKKLAISTNTISNMHNIFKDIPDLVLPECFGNTSDYQKNEKDTKKQYTKDQSATVNAKEENMFGDSNLNIDTMNSEKCTQLIQKSKLSEKFNTSAPHFTTSTPQFTTASGKKLAISTNTISNIHNIFKDIPDLVLPECFGNTSDYQKNEKDTKKQYTKDQSATVNAKEENMLGDSKLNIDTMNSEKCTQLIQKSKLSEKSNTSAPHFTTASGKKLLISSNKLSTLQNIFKDIPDLAIPEYFENISNHKENEKEMKKQYTNTQSSTLNAEEKMFGDCNIISGPNTPMNSEKCFQSKKDTKTFENFNASSPQFTTASGKKLVISSNKLSNIKNIFKDIPDLPISEYFSNACDNQKGKTQMNNQDKNFHGATGVPSLFGTASGKPIDLATSDYTGVKHIFKDVANFNSVGSSYKMESRVEKTRDDSKISSNKNCRAVTRTSKSIAQSVTSNSKNIGLVSALKNTTPQRKIPVRRRLAESTPKGEKISDAALNRAKMLFGDINFDDLKLPLHLKVSSPTISETSLSTPIKINGVNSSPFSSTPFRVRKRNESFLDDIHQESLHPYIIQKPTSKNLTEIEQDLNRQKIILEKKLQFIVEKQNAVKNQIQSHNANKKFKFDPQEKKNKINLKDLKNLEMQSDPIEEIHGTILQINPQNAALIHFNNNWYEVPSVTTEDGCCLVPNSQGLIGISEIEQGFISMIGIEKKLIPDGWIKNHYRWIIWKLASYERIFPTTLGGCFNINNVIKQLKYRYFKEIHNAERPALRKIYEMDDIPQKRMVLCISNIIKNGDQIELELTDGWYSIRTIVDDPLCYQINEQKIRIGTKIMITGAELMNCEGCHPLEFEQSKKVRLKIHFNSTRRATWYAKLGYQKDPSPPLIKISSAVWNGGTIGKITVYILRIYPMVYREKTESSVVWRNESAELRKIRELENEYMNDYELGNNVNIPKRNVCSLLQMAVIDISEDCPKPFKCTIWDASDIYREQLREHQIVSFYNITLRCNGEFSYNKKSYFQICKCETVKYEKYRRKCVELSSYQEMSKNSVFGEFDTVGYILKRNIYQNYQNFWLSDLRNNFLFVAVQEGPNSCLLLNKVEEGHLVAVCNLNLQKSEVSYSNATASLHSIVTQYPQYAFLGDKMEALEQETKNGLLSAIDEYKKMVKDFESGIECEQRSHSNRAGGGLNISTVASSEEVMTSMDIDEILENRRNL